MNRMVIWYWSMILPVGSEFWKALFAVFRKKELIFPDFPPKNILFTFKDICFQLLFIFLGKYGSSEALLIIPLQVTLATITGFSHWILSTKLNRNWLKAPMRLKSGIICCRMWILFFVAPANWPVKLTMPKTWLRKHFTVPSRIFLNWRTGIKPRTGCFLSWKTCSSRTWRKVKRESI